jgi:hypothetical protein
VGIRYLGHRESCRAVNVLFRLYLPALDNLTESRGDLSCPLVSRMLVHQWAS